MMPLASVVAATNLLKKKTDFDKNIPKLLVEFVELDPTTCDQYEGSPHCFYCDASFDVLSESKHEDDCLWLRIKTECDSIGLEGMVKKL